MTLIDRIADFVLMLLLDPGFCFGFVFSFFFVYLIELFRRERSRL